MDRPRKPRSRNTAPTITAFLAATAVAVRVLAGAAIVEAVAVSSFGLVAGTVIAVLVAMVMGITYLALGRSLLEESATSHSDANNRGR